MDTLQGACGNLSVLHAVLGRRIGLPVSLACAGPHYICRFDDGTEIINIETTNTGNGGFSSQADESPTYTTAPLLDSTVTPIVRQASSAGMIFAGSTVVSR
jgi:hypothetical protein